MNRRGRQSSAGRDGVWGSEVGLWDLLRLVMEPGKEGAVKGLGVRERHQIHIFERSLWVNSDKMMVAVAAQFWISLDPYIKRE